MLKKYSYNHFPTRVISELLKRLQTHGLRTVGYELTDRQRKVHLYVEYAVCDADRPILSVVRFLASGWSIKIKGKQRLMVKDDVRIELTTHRGLFCVSPMHRVPPERMTPPKHTGVVYHINPNKPKIVYVRPIQRTDKDHWRFENCHPVRVHRKWRKRCSNHETNEKCRYSSRNSWVRELLRLI